MEIKDFNMGLFSLKGKNALVTGGNTGLGQAFSMALATAGANVFMAGVDPENHEFTKDLESRGAKTGYMYADLSNEDTAKEVVEKCVETLGSIDILVNCAGICPIDNVIDYDSKKWNPTINVNLNAAFYMSHEAAKKMIEQKSGKIINICSLFSFLGGQWAPAYAASKHGLAGLTKAYCDELAQFNIQVNGIAPGYFKTKAAEASINDPERSKWIVDHTPEGRWGDVADLMGAVVFLASEASHFVNGHILAVDGGWLVR
ncbi:SDR family oxidoreductase [Streptococcus suis]|nr:SDR family oxidoreductase [Streptococcus suis]